jgi:glutamine amidotransferase
LTKLAILDLGYGNTRSVALAFDRLGIAPVLTADPSVAAGADRLVVPGVGAAAQAMRRLGETGLDDIVRQRSRPTLGICLGMQLLFERSEEDGGTPLLAILPGTVAELQAKAGYPVPHMGWSRLDSVGTGAGLAEGDYCYFAHSFACPPLSSMSAITHYGTAVIPAAVRAGPFWGVQFHPERSSAAGAAFLQAFIAA